MTCTTTHTHAQRGVGAHSIIIQPHNTWRHTHGTAAVHATPTPHQLRCGYAAPSHFTLIDRHVLVVLAASSHLTTPPVSPEGHGVSTDATRDSHQSTVPRSAPNSRSANGLHAKEKQSEDKQRGTHHCTGLRCTRTERPKHTQTHAEGLRGGAAKA